MDSTPKKIKELFMHKNNLLLIIVLCITTNTSAMERALINAEILTALLDSNNSTTNYPYCFSESTLPPLRLERESKQKTNILVKYSNEKHIYAKSFGPDLYGQHNIKTFNIRSGEKKQKFPGDKLPICRCVSTLDNQIIIASDGSRIIIQGAGLNIKPYSFKTGCSVTNIAAEDDTLCSSNFNNGIQIWNIKEKCCKCLEGKVLGKNICNLMIHNKLIYIGCDDGTIITFDLRTGENIYNWHAHQQQISSLIPGKRNDYCLYSGSEDHSINIWDIRNLFTYTNQLNLPHTSHKNLAITNMLEDKEARILFASDDDTVYEWDVSHITPQLLSSLCLQSPIKNNCMVLDENETETTIGKELHVGTEDGIKTIRCDYSFDELLEEVDTQ